MFDCEWFLKFSTVCQLATPKRTFVYIIIFGTDRKMNGSRKVLQQLLAFGTVGGAAFLAGGYVEQLKADRKLQHLSDHDPYVLHVSDKVCALYF